MKISAQVHKDQSGVWDQVETTQKKLSEATGKTVNNPASASSLQLALEDKDLNQKISAYQTELAGIVNNPFFITNGYHPKPVGFVFFTNGKINSGDTYATNTLFKKLWPKLLLAMSQEAFADSNSPTTKTPVNTVTANFLEDFLSTAASGLIKETKFLENTEQVLQETKTTIFIESRPKNRKDQNLWFHRSYLAK